jgi:integrase
VALTVGGKTLATAYARRSPGNRSGTEHWSWVAMYADLATGKPLQASLGRLPTELVGTKLAEFYRGVDPSAIKSDGSGLATVGDLLRAYFAHAEGREGTADALAEDTIEFYEGSAKRLMPIVGHTALRDVSEAWVLAVRDARLKTGAVRTVQADLKFIRQAVMWARKRGVEVPDVSITHAVKFKSRKATVYVNNHHTPTEAEVERLYKDMRRSGAKLALYIMWQTGCRIGEASVLSWKHLERDADGYWVFFWKGKTGPRHTPITSDVYDEIRRYMPEGAMPETALFKRPKRTNSSTGAAIAESCRKRGIEPFTSHGLRRMFTDRCIRARVDVGTYADIAGHSIETALSHYRTVTVDDRIAALHRISNPSTVDLLVWLARHGVSEEEAIRVLTDWTGSEPGRLRQREHGGGADRGGLLPPGVPDGLGEVAGDDPPVAPPRPPNVVH